MKYADILIIGQGIAGTLLSYELLRAGKTVMVIDQPTIHKASLAASAVINPLIGKTWSVAKDAGELIPKALEVYRQMEVMLNIPLISEKSLLIDHQDTGAALTFEQQRKARNPYARLPDENELVYFSGQFRNHGNIGKVSPVYLVDAASLLQKWKQHLQNLGSYSKGQFSFEDLSLNDSHVLYQDIRAEQIIFCEGVSGMNNMYFPRLHFTANRGDALLLSIPGLSANHLYQKGIRLVPKSDGTFWCGSNYTWTYEDMQPDLVWQKETLDQLQSWLSLPFELLDHLVAARPTTAGQIPILLRHPQYRNMFCFNGLGTRGFSAGPALASRMAALILSW